MTPHRKTLDRALSFFGVASRSLAVELIVGGRVTVNGRCVRAPEHWIELESDRIQIDGREIGPPTALRVVIYNKPRGVVVTARDPEGRLDLALALPEPYRTDTSLRAVGRLDRASAGLLLLMNDMGLADRLLTAEAAVTKIYRVKLAPPPTAVDIERLAIGIDIGDARPTLPARVTLERTNPKSAVLRFELHEGRNRQIRRMAQAIGCEVEWLVRTHFGPIALDSLEPGAAREATADEVKALASMAPG
ncbi:MAG: pseudouridine synthase [Planctomycetota bacterium]